MDNGPLFHKPKSLLTARQVLYTGIFLAALQFALSALNVGFANTGGLKVAGIIAAYSVVVFWLLREVNIGLKWARTVLTAILLLAMMIYPCAVFQLIKTNLIQITLLAIQLVLQIYLIVLLYKKESTEWLNSFAHNKMLP